MAAKIAESTLVNAPQLSRAQCDALLDRRCEYGQVVAGKLPEIQTLIRINLAKGFIHNERLGRNRKLVHGPGIDCVDEPRDDVERMASFVQASLR